MGKRLGYLRVSTHEQRPDRQIDALKEQCDQLHVEKISAVSRRRPVYEALVSKLKPGDTLVVLDLDRAFRSAKDALTQMDDLRARGIEFHIANLALDTKTPVGKFVYTVLSAFAEMERNMLSQRTREGLAAARRRGKRLGRPPKLSLQQIGEARGRFEAHERTMQQLALDYGVSRITLSRAFKHEVQ